MKKLFLALAAVVCLFTACQKEEPTANEEVAVNLSFDINANQTRSLLGTATSAQGGLTNLDDAAYDLRYHLEIYKDINGEPVKDRMTEYVDNFNTSSAANFALRLFPGEYTFVVYADFVEQGSLVDYNYNTTDNNLKEVTVIRNVINDESRDMYFYTQKINVQNGNNAITETIQLRRPFGKLRVVTTDLEHLNPGASLETVTVKYQSANVVGFNAVTGELLSAGNQTEYTANVVDYKEVDEDTQATLFVDYIFANVDQSVVHFELTTNTSDGPSTYNFTTDIPVKRNALTTIKGNVLTTGKDITVTVDDLFASTEQKDFTTINGLDDLLYAVSHSGTYIVLSDLYLTSEALNAYNAPAATRNIDAINAIIDLNGKTIRVKNTSNEALLPVPATTTLTFAGEGESKIVLEEGSTAPFIDTPADDAGNKGTINIAGETQLTDNTSGVGVAGAEANVVENCELVDNNGQIEVARKADAQSLQNIINEAKEGSNYIVFSGDIVAEEGITILQKEGVNIEIDGKGFKFDGVITVNGNARANGAETLKFKNINFETSANDFTFISAPSKINDKYNYSHNVTIEDCTFNGNQTVGSASFTGTYNFVMRNCTAENMHSILQVQSCDNTVLVEGVTVTDCKNGISFGNTAYPTLKNSTINATEYGVRGDGNASRGNLVIEKTTITAAKPVIIRKVTTAGYSVELANEVELNTDELYDVVFTEGADDAEYVAPKVSYSITGADNYVVCPLDFLESSNGNIAISSIVGLNYFRDQVNGGNTFAGKTVTLASNIDLKKEPWTPIANFQGTFDGQNHTISNLVVNGGSKSDQGFFGFTQNGEIKNLTIENAKVSGRLNVGVVAGTPYTSKYTNITVKGHVEVNGMAYVGGVAGKNAYANWENVTVNVDETSYVNANSVENGKAYRTYVGGVVGFNGEGGHSFKNITSNIDVKGSTIDVGGLFGIAHYGNKFENCSCSGDVEIYAATEAEEAQEIGGIAGVWHNETGYQVTFTGCSFTGTLKTNIDDVMFYYGGLVGKPYNATGTGKLIWNGSEFVLVGTADELVAAKNVLFKNDITINPATQSSGYGKAGVVIVGGQIFDGKGYKLDVKGANATWDCAVAAKGGVISNMTVAGAMRGIFMPGADADLFIDNVVFENVIYTFNSDAGNKNYGVYVSNSTLNGWTSHSDAHKEVVYTNCSFGEGNGYKFCRPYGPTSFVNCDFCEGFEVDARGKITFENCTLNGVALTSANLATLVTSNRANASVK